MAFVEKLDRALAKFGDLNFQGSSLHLRHGSIKVHIILVGQIIIHVISGDGCCSGLLVPENQINPFIDVCGDIVGFKPCSHFQQIVLRMLCPLWQDHIIDYFALWSGAHFQFLAVDEEVTVSGEELRGEFLEVGCGVHRAVIGTFDAAEDSVGRVEHTILQPNDEFRDFSNQIVCHVARSWVVGWVEMRGVGECLIFTL